MDTARLGLHGGSWQRIEHGQDGAAHSRQRIGRDVLIARPFFATWRDGFRNFLNYALLRDDCRFHDRLRDPQNLETSIDLDGCAVLLHTDPLHLIINICDRSVRDSLPIVHLAMVPCSSHEAKHIEGTSWRICRQLVSILCLGGQKYSRPFASRRIVHAVIAIHLAAIVSVEGRLARLGVSGRLLEDRLVQTYHIPAL